MTIQTEAALRQLEADLHDAFPDTTFSLEPFSIPGVGRAININWRLGPLGREVEAVTNTMIEDISLFISRIEPCAVCGRDGPAGVACFHCEPDKWHQAIPCDDAEKQIVDAIDEVSPGNGARS